MHPYFVRSACSSGFIDLILKFDVLQTEVPRMVIMEQKYQKRAELREKGLKLKTLTIMRIYISI